MPHTSAADTGSAAAQQALCIDTTVRFFHALDQFDHAACVALMTSDGSWDRQGRLFTGRADVLAMLDERVRTRRTCHVLTNLSATLLAPDRARVEFCLLAYEGQTGQADTVPVGRLAGIRRGTDDLERTADGWRISHKRSEAVFRGAP